MLELRDIHTYYGNIEALKGVSLKISEGEIISLIGANGAGKSTTLMSICGVVPPRQGEVIFEGKSITTTPPNKIVSLGICQVPEGRRIFPYLSVLENLDMGAFLRRDKEGIRQDIDYVFELFPILAQRRHQAGGTLSGGEQQMLAISRAIMTRPRLLLLDEPAAGMNPSETGELMENIKRIRDTFEIAVLLIAHDMNLVMGICEGIAVLNYGKIIAKGTPEQIKSNPVVIEAYLGRRGEAKA